MTKLIACVVLVLCFIGLIEARSHNNVWGVRNRQDVLLAREMIMRPGRLGVVTTYDYVYKGAVSLKLNFNSTSVQN